MPFSLNPAVAALYSPPDGTPPAPRQESAVGDIDNRRKQLAPVLAALAARAPAYPSVDVKNLSTKATDGHQLLLRWYSKKDAKAPGSAVLYIHGGGMYTGSVQDWNPIVTPIAEQTGVPILAVGYRVAPEFRAPTQVTDCYAGLQYLVAHAADLGVDPQRIAIMGDSAGGGIAAGLAHYIKQQKGPFVKQQILVYPMLDDRTATANANGKPTLSWSVNDNKTGWVALLGDRFGAADVTPVEAPGRATLEDALGLPPAYIDVGQLDLFAAENLAYASLLHQAGVDVELHFLPGIPHGCDQMIPGEDIIKRTFAHRFAAIQSL